MKHFYLLLITVAFYCSCDRQICTISGKITDPVDTVTLVNQSGDVLDKCAVIDGSFTLTCDMNPENGVSIIRGNPYAPIALIPDSKKINVVMVEGKPVVSGSLLSEEVQELQQWTMETFMESNQRSKVLIENGYPERADSISNEFYKVLVDRCREVYLDHKSDLVGSQAMVLMMNNIDEDEFLNLYEQGGKVIHEDARISGYYGHLKSISLNEVIILQDNGEFHMETGKIEDFVGMGKYTLVDFWASWCGPCRKEMPFVVKAYNDYKDKGLVVLGIPVQDKLEATQKAMTKMGIYYPQLCDPTTDLAQKFHVRGIPHLFLFDPEGKIVKEGMKGKEVDALLRPLFQ